MSALFCLCAQALATTIASDSGDKLEIRSTSGESEIKLPSKALATLTTWNAKFKLFASSDYSPSVRAMFQSRGSSEVPMAFIADVDGDKTSDIVLLGEAEKKQMAIALLNSKGKWTVLTIKTWEIADVKKSEVPGDDAAETGVPFYILPAQGPVATEIKGKKGIQIEAYMGSVEIFEIKDGKAVSVKF